MSFQSAVTPAASRPALPPLPHSRPAANDTDLEGIRGEIERIDDQLLELVHERLALSDAIGRCKARTGDDGLLIRPDREAQIQTRLRARTSPGATSAVAGLWRELMAQCLQVQRASAIVMHAAQEPVLVTDAVRVRFGCAAPLVAAADAADALDHARTHPAMAVIELTPLGGWWAELDGDPELTIMDGIRANGRVVALAVGRMPSGHAGRQAFAIMTDERLAAAVAADEAWQPIALSGHLRLCAAEPAGGEW